MNSRAEIDEICEELKKLTYRYTDDFNIEMNRNNFVLAKKKIENEIDKYPNNLNLKSTYGYILIKTGYIENAKQIYSNLIINEDCPHYLKYYAISNYMMVCNYIGILNEDRLNIKKYYPLSQNDPPIISNSNKIKLGYITSDAFNHPVGRALGKIIENHNKDKFEINIFYTGESIDYIAKNIIDICDKMIYVGSYGQPNAISSKQLYQILREMKIDILIDCNGHTAGGIRLPLFCKRPCLCNVAMLGYPNTIGLDCYDLRVSSEIVTINNQLWTEPIFNNPYGYMPYFKSVDCISLKHNDIEIITLGCISPIAKISIEDIQYYDKLLLLNDQFRLLYARLGTCYDKEKANWIINCHKEENRNKIVIINLKKYSYLKLFEMIDIILDHTNWSNHMLFQDAYSCGVPSILMDNTGQLPCSLLSRDLIKTIEWGITNIKNSAIPCLGKERLQSMSKAIFKKMHRFDNSKQWTNAYEEALVDLYKRKRAEIKV